MTHRHAVRIAAVAIALLGACNDDGDPSVTADRPPPETIDEAMERRFAAAGLAEPELAGRTELCRRLFADFVGRFPSADEVADTCADRSADAIAAELQSRPEYVTLGMRIWRDRLATSDALVAWRDLLPTFTWVEKLQRQEIDYEQFTIGVLAEPGVMAPGADAESRAYRVHRAFLGGAGNPAMIEDLARLTRVWDVRSTSADSFGPVQQEFPRAYVVLGNCGTLGTCKTELYPGGEISFDDLGARPLAGIKHELLTDTQKAALTGLGRHVVTLPTFWEAAADDVLDRLLDWNDGGREPRRPGRLLPEVRELVVAHLRETKSIASAERLVVASVLYRQTHRGADAVAPSSDAVAGGRPVWASGPLKFTRAETLIDTLRGTSDQVASCDARTADDDIYRLHRLGYFLSDEDPAAYADFIREYAEDQGNWRPLVEQEVADPDDPTRTATLLDLDRSYFDTARLFGGCPGSESPRLTALDGLGYAFGQEVAARRLCDGPAIHELVGAEAPISEIVPMLFSRLLSRRPTADELAEFSAEPCTGDCDAVAQVCAALLASHEMLFY